MIEIYAKAVDVVASCPDPGQDAIFTICGNTFDLLIPLSDIKEFSKSRQGDYLDLILDDDDRQVSSAYRIDPKSISYISYYTAHIDTLRDVLQGHLSQLPKDKDSGEGAQALLGYI